MSLSPPSYPFRPSSFIPLLSSPPPSSEYSPSSNHPHPSSFFSPPKCNFHPSNSLINICKPCKEFLCSICLVDHIKIHNQRDLKFEIESLEKKNEEAKKCLEKFKLKMGRNEFEETRKKNTEKEKEYILFMLFN